MKGVKLLEKHLNLMKKNVKINNPALDPRLRRTTRYGRETSAIELAAISMFRYDRREKIIIVITISDTDRDFKKRHYKQSVDDLRGLGIAGRNSNRTVRPV